MEYRNLSVENEIQGYNTRIAQLEEEHMSNGIFAFEAEVIGDTASLAQFKNANASIELRIEKLTAKVEELSELLETNSEDTQNGNSG